MIFTKRVNYFNRFILLFIATGLIFTLLILMVSYIEFTRYEQNKDLQRAKNEIKQKKIQLKNFSKEFEHILSTLDSNRFLNEYHKNKTTQNKQNLTTLFEVFAKSENAITQFRYIDQTGQEIIRVNKEGPDKSVAITPENKLQNKKDRYYFTQTIKKQKNEIYISKIDLNVENEKIEVPYKPVWRFATPVYFQEQKRGIIIINVFAKYILEDLLRSDSFYIDIYDKQGDILVSSDKEKNQWTKYLNLNSQLDKGDFIYSDLLLNIPTDGTLFMGFIQKKWLSSFLEQLNSNIYYFIIFANLIAFILAYFLAKIPKRLFDDIEEQQQILIDQSKVAAMGEMTTMLAHQWRQPLNTFGVLIINLEEVFKQNQLTEKYFFNLTAKFKKNIQYMSSTIDNFRDFSNTDKEKENIDIYRLIEDTYSILDMRLKKNFINHTTKKINCPSDTSTMLYQSKGELEQVIVNIINNAIENIEEKIEKNDQNNRNSYFINTFIRCDRDIITILIKDNGGGIDNNMLQTLFQPYSSTKKERNGTGIGLYMSQMIIEKNMEGSLRAYNEQDGAVFEIKIPVGEIKNI